jgi:hypothetical protein
MARATRVELNRKALNNIAMAFVDGVSAIGQAIIENADPPDATPFGVGLVGQGGVLTYIGPKQVFAWSLSGPKPQKPKSVKVRSETGNILGIVGFGFPGKFQELGTIHQPARPFLWPAVNRTDGKAILDRVVRPRLR